MAFSYIIKVIETYLNYLMLFYSVSHIILFVALIIKVILTQILFVIGKFLFEYI